VRDADTGEFNIEAGALCWPIMYVSIVV
jgi:hypothetical protein